MSRLRDVTVIMIDMYFIVIFVAVHLLVAVFNGDGNVRWFITLNEMRQVIFLDTIFLIALILETYSMVLKLIMITGDGRS